MRGIYDLVILNEEDAFSAEPDHEHWALTFPIIFASLPHLMDPSVTMAGARPFGVQEQKVLAF